MKARKRINHDKHICKVRGRRWPHECAVCGNKGCAAYKHKEYAASDERTDVHGLTPSRGTPLVTCRQPVPLRIICMHLGLAWRADFRECFVQLISHFNANASFDTVINLDWCDIDLQPAGNEHFLNEASRDLA